MAKKTSAKTAPTGSAKRKTAGSKTSRKAATTVLVVNMMPRALSGESHQDSEPTLAVNPANPLQIAGSAFTPDPGGGNLAPIFTSVDGGNTWTLKSIVPSSAADGSATSDITVAFSTKSNRLYAGIIRVPFPPNRPRLNILRTNDFQSAVAMKVLVDRTGRGVDQPYVQAATVASGASIGKDRVYVGDNDFNATPRSATIDQSLDAGKTTPSFKSVRIESRTTAGQDGPPIRPAIHPDGTVYAIFHSWRTFDNSGEGTADIVVVRDDSGGSGTTKFRSLLDAGDGKAGVRVVKDVKFNFDGFLGLQRTGGDVNIAVDPSTSSNVYIAYNDDVGPDYMLHVLRSTDRGVTWSTDLRTIRNALNPALAINTAGRVGLLYQQLMGSGPTARWVTQFESSDNGTTWNPITLATVPANSPPKTFDPYLGDYDHMMSVGKDFYGVFCANNTPNKSNFPKGVTYQRNANFTSHTLLDVDNVTPVDVSIDPFFFKVTG
ncbi:MAG TPA: hypothetical protein VE422_26540 [Terriglobia bacterium]|nr:hypothetical protein [Terriglobia bacterium]